MVHWRQHYFMWKIFTIAPLYPIPYTRTQLQCIYLRTPQWPTDDCVWKPGCQHTSDMVTTVSIRHGSSLMITAYVHRWTMYSNWWLTLASVLRPRWYSVATRPFSTTRVSSISNTRNVGLHMTNGNRYEHLMAMLHRRSEHIVCMEFGNLQRRVQRSITTTAPREKARSACRAEGQGLCA